MSNTLIIAGFHRSGTSLTARILHQAGLYLGDNLLGGNPSNRHGHFEDQEILDLHNDILADHQKTWQVKDPFEVSLLAERQKQLEAMVTRRNRDHEWWGFKEPRVCSLLDVWKRTVENAKTLIIYRHYSECAHSLHRRAASVAFRNDRLSSLHRQFWEIPDLALRMWLVANRGLIEYCKKHPKDVVVLSLESLKLGCALIPFLNDKWNMGLTQQAVDSLDPTAFNVFDKPLGLSNKALIEPLHQVWSELEALEEPSLRMKGRAVPQDDFYTPSDVDSLRLENELLGLENSYLKSQDIESREAIRAKSDGVLQAHMRRWESSRTVLTEKARRARDELLAIRTERRDLKEQIHKLSVRAQESQSVIHSLSKELKKDRAKTKALEAELEVTRRDMAWLISRLNTWPFRWFIRRRKLRAIQNRHQTP